MAQYFSPLFPKPGRNVFTPVHMMIYQEMHISGSDSRGKTLIEVFALRNLSTVLAKVEFLLVLLQWELEWETQHSYTTTTK